MYEWFADARVNTCYNAVDRHVENGRGDQAAIIYDSPITGTKSTSPTPNCKTRVAALAGGLARKGRAQRRPRHHLHADGARGP